VNTGREDEYNTFHAKIRRGECDLGNILYFRITHMARIIDIEPQKFASKHGDDVDDCHYYPSHSTVNISFLMNTTNDLPRTARTARFTTCPTPPPGSSLTKCSTGCAFTWDWLS
jgi:hypothetical protein